MYIENKSMTMQCFCIGYNHAMEWMQTESFAATLCSNVDLHDGYNLDQPPSVEANLGS